jgi:hypothetical protein
MKIEITTDAQHALEPISKRMVINTTRSKIIFAKLVKGNLLMITP